MALSLQSGNLVWQKVKNYLSQDNAGASNQGTNPAAQGAFLDLKAYLAQQKRNLQLQFVSFASEDVIAVDGITIVGGVAFTLYGLYARSRSTQTGTAAFLNLHQATTTDASTTTMITARFFDVKQEFVYVNGFGMVISSTGGILAMTTTVGGDTASAVADGVDGFVIVGA